MACAIKELAVEIIHGPDEYYDLLVLNRACTSLRPPHGPALFRETAMYVTRLGPAGMSRRRRSLLYRGGLWLCLIAALLPITGCASSRRQGSADGQLASEQSASFVADNTAGGAATGAVIGCIAGALLDVLLIVATRGQASPGIGCAVGAAAGAVAGGVDGYTKGNEAQAQANRVLETRSVAADIAKENATLQSAVEIAQRVVDRDRERLDRIKTDLATKTISLENAQVQAAFIRQNTAQIAAILDDARKQRASFLTARKGLQDGDTTAVDREIGEFETKIAQLESQLASVNAALTLTALN
jgi:hypothetical protein